MIDENPNLFYSMNKEILRPVDNDEQFFKKICSFIRLQSNDE
jgi:hypothetical protein